MTYRAGIIGAGGIAGLGILGLHDKDDIGEKKFETGHAGGYDAVSDVELVAIADTERERLDTFGEVWEIPPERRYEDHTAMLGDLDLDIVSVCTPTLFHHDHVTDAVTSAADPDVVWCEKPIASNLDDAREMCAVAADHDCELVVNHSFRFTDKYRQLRSLLSDGLLGEVEAVNAQFRRELLRNSTHLLDTLVYLLDARPDRVSGYINQQNDAVDDLEGRDVDDSGGGGTVVLDDGTFAMIDCTIAREISSMTMQFIGTEGKLYVNNDDGEWRYWDLEDGTHVEKPLPGIDGDWRWDVDYRDSFPNAVEHLVGVLEGTEANQSPGEAAIRSLEIIVGFYISHHTDSQLSLPIEGPMRDVTITSW